MVIVVKRKRKKSNGVFFERILLKSLAYRSLRTPACYVALAAFWMKRRMEEQGQLGRERWVVANNGGIIFTYAEARRKYGFATGTFRTAVDELRRVGLIDIVEGGAGLYRSANRYGISNRWRAFGTPDFEEPTPRPKGPMNRGFRFGNRYGRNCGLPNGRGGTKAGPEQPIERVQTGTTNKVPDYQI
jgi:hypothetical protein